MRRLISPLTAIAFLSLAMIANAGVKPGDDAPAFSLQDQNGKTVNLSDFQGKIVVLEWFNADCPFVQRHYKAKTMNDTNDKYKDKDVVWLAINSTAGKKPADNKSAAQSMNVDHPILADTESDVAKAYGAKSTPHMFIIDKNGKIAYEGGIDNDPDGDKGSGRVNYVDKALSEMLDGKPVSEPQTKQYGCGVHFKK
jgi:peroxiredoxin